MRVFAVILLVFIAGDFSVAQEAPLSGPEIFKRCKKTHADIATLLKFEGKSDFERHGYGAGVFTDEGVLLTSTHVIKLKRDRKIKFIMNEKGKNDLKQPLFIRKEFKIAEYRYEIQVYGSDRIYTADILGWSFDIDLATMKVNGIDPEAYKIAKLGNSANLQIGETIYALGSPKGMSGSFTKGIVSKLNCNPGRLKIENQIQVDAAINPGNSGGGLINEKAELVGIMVTKNRTAEGMAYAVPINFFDPDKFSDKGEISRPVLGLEIMPKDFKRRGTKDKPHFEDLKKLHELTGMNGKDDQENLTNLHKIIWGRNRFVVVTRIVKDSVAEKSGFFKRGDVIVKADGREINKFDDLLLTLMGYNTDKPLALEILRAKEGIVSKHNLSLKFKGDVKK